MAGKKEEGKFCKHEKVVINPGKAEKEGDGVVVGDFEHGTLYCQQCRQELPMEDLGTYSDDQVSVAIPADLVD